MQMQACGSGYAPLRLPGHRLRSSPLARQLTIGDNINTYHRHAQYSYVLDPMTASTTPLDVFARDGLELQSCRCEKYGLEICISSRDVCVV